MQSVKFRERHENGMKIFSIEYEGKILFKFLDEKKALEKLDDVVSRLGTNYQKDIKVQFHPVIKK